MICPHCHKDTDATASVAAGRFAQFWAEYPLKKAKKDAEKAFNKEADSDIQAYVMIEGLRKQLPEMRKNPKYIPYAASWIRGRRWEDEASGAQETGAGRTARVIACELCGDSGLYEDLSYRRPRLARCSCARGQAPGLLIPQGEEIDPEALEEDLTAPF